MTSSSPGGAQTDGLNLAPIRWALTLGNFAAGCGVVVVGGTLNDLASSFDTSVASAGQLISAGAAAMCIGAPLLAWWTSGFDRRRLLVTALAWYALGHALCTLCSSYALLAPLRAMTLLGAAVVTPQAAAAVSLVAPLREQARSVAFVFLGWSLAFVFGMPMASYLGESFGWRASFLAVSVLSALSAVSIHVVLPARLKSPALSAQAWKRALTHPVLMSIIAVSALQAAGQFTQAAYLAPYYRRVLSATPLGISFLFGWFGALGLLGNLLLVRRIERFGCERAVLLVISGIALSLLVWPLAHDVPTMAAVIAPWSLSCFAANSAQQARLNRAAPPLAQAIMALNTSAIYLGQAVGAAGGGWLLTNAGGFAALHWGGLAWALCAIALSLWVGRRISQHDPDTVTVLVPGQ